MTTAPDIRVALSRRRLLAEFLLFFLLAPAAMAVLFPPRLMFPVLFAFTALGLVLLTLTPGFRWRELVRGLGRISPAFVALVALGTALVGYLVIQYYRPDAFLVLIRRNPDLMLTIALAYPPVSALPQELVFRPLFFRRYAAILPQAAVPALVLNAAVFAWAHLMYWSAVVAAMTFVGGLVFAWSYRVRGNFPEAVVSHSLAGVIVFALGLGVFFYSGNVVRPF